MAPPNVTQSSSDCEAWFPYGHYRLLSVVYDLLRSVELLGLWKSLQVVGGLSGSLTVAKYFVLFPYNTNQTSGSLAVFQGHSRSFESVLATQSLAVFEGRYLPLQKFHSCFLIVVDEISIW